MSSNLSKKTFSVFRNALFESITCVVYMYVFEHCLNDFTCGIALCAWKS